ncbi:MAG: matrixin family metalloprotease [Acidothermaceae bacterium]
MTAPAGDGPHRPPYPPPRGPQYPPPNPFAGHQQQPVFDDYFVTSARRIEPSSAARIANANRIATGHATLSQQQMPPGWTTPAARLLVPVSRQGGRSIGNGIWLPVFVVLAIVIALVAVRTGKERAAAIGAGDGLFGSVTSQPPTRYFPDPTRILPAPTPVAATGGYTVLDARSGGQPVTWDPCQPIHFVVRSSGEIPGGRVLLDQAMAEISKDTGLFFMDDGTTTEAPNPHRNPYRPDLYGKSWAPVLITWSNPTEYPGLAGDVIGLAGPVAVGGKNAHIVSGEVVFDGPDLTQLEDVPEGSTFAYDVMLHELGHLVGLGHIDDVNSVMNPVSSRPLRGYSPGDLRGLAAMGSGRCLTKG